MIIGRKVVKEKKEREIERERLTCVCVCVCAIERERGCTHINMIIFIKEIATLNHNHERLPAKKIDDQNNNNKYVCVCVCACACACACEYVCVRER